MTPATIKIDGVIGTGPGEVSSREVRAMLPADTSRPLSVEIHSEGGSVFEGFAIHDLLASYPGPKTARIASSAFSIASFIPMACDEIEITPNGYMMLHNPYAEIEGDDEALASNADLLKQLKGTMIAAYAKRSGKSPEDVAAILKRETYLNAADAVAQGFATRITGEPVHGRVFAKLNNLPHGVVSALFRVDSGGKQESPTKGKPMSESTPAATIQEIRAAYPKAKAEFVLNCVERSMPMASVAVAAMEEVMKENADLAAKCLAMEDELKALKAKAAGEGGVPPEEEEPATAAKATAKRTGVAPVAKAKGVPAVSARVRWDEILTGYTAKGMSKAQAARKANAEHPDVREAMVAEANA